MRRRGRCADDRVFDPHIYRSHPKVFGDAPTRIPPFDDEEFDVRLWWPEGTALIEDAPAKAERDTTLGAGGSESGGT